MQRLTEVRTVIFCSFLALMIAACDQDVLYSTSFTEVATERTKLIDGIESYQSAEESKSQFQKWEVIENSSLAPGDKRPPFSIHVVAIDNYSHLQSARGGEILSKQLRSICGAAKRSRQTHVQGHGNKC